jgi:DNA-binding NtrC family response regulator
MLTYTQILLFSNDDAEIRSFQTLFEEHAITKTVRDLEELQSSLNEDIFDAVFCGWSYSTGSWIDVLARVQRSSPDLPVVICSRTGGETEWIKVLQAGGFDLLVAPYQKGSVLPVLEQAVNSYKARRFYNSDSYAKAVAS